MRVYKHSAGMQCSHTVFTAKSISTAFKGKLPVLFARDKTPCPKPFLL